MIDKTLLECVAAVVETIVQRKIQNGTAPFAAEYNAIINELKPDILECMRTLHRQGLYRGGININKEPILIINDSKK